MIVNAPLPSPRSRTLTGERGGGHGREAWRTDAPRTRPTSCTCSSTSAARSGASPAPTRSSTRLFVPARGGARAAGRFTAYDAGQWPLLLSLPGCGAAHDGVGIFFFSVVLSFLRSAPAVPANNGASAAGARLYKVLGPAERRHCTTRCCAAAAASRRRPRTCGSARRPGAPTRSAGGSTSPRLTHLAGLQLQAGTHLCVVAPEVAARASRRVIDNRRIEEPARADETMWTGESVSDPAGWSRTGRMALSRWGMLSAALGVAVVLGGASTILCCATSTTRGPQSGPALARCGCWSPASRSRARHERGTRLVDAQPRPGQPRRTLVLTVAALAAVLATCVAVARGDRERASAASASSPSPRTT